MTIISTTTIVIQTYIYTWIRSDCPDSIPWDTDSGSCPLRFCIRKNSHCLSSNIRPYLGSKMDTFGKHIITKRSGFDSI